MGNINNKGWSCMMLSSSGTNVSESLNFDSFCTDWLSPAQCRTQLVETTRNVHFPVRGHNHKRSDWSAGSCTSLWFVFPQKLLSCWHHANTDLPNEQRWISSGTSHCSALHNSHGQGRAIELNQWSAQLQNEEFALHSRVWRCEAKKSHTDTLCTTWSLATVP